MNTRLITEEFNTVRTDIRSIRETSDKFYLDGVKSADRVVALLLKNLGGTISVIREGRIRKFIPKELFYSDRALVVVKG